MDSATPMAIEQPGVRFLGRQAARWAGWLRGEAAMSFLALADQAVVSGANFLTTILVGRTCLPGELGIYSLGFTIVVLLLGVQQSLICTPFMVYIHRVEGRRRAEYTGSVLAHVGMLSAVLAVGLALVGMLGGGWEAPRLTLLLLVLAWAVPCQLLRDFARRCAFARLHMGTALGLDLAMAALQLGGLAGLAARGWLSAVGAHALVGLACLLAGGTWLALTWGDFVIRPRLVGPEARRSWSLGKWIFLGTAVGMVHTYLMHWLLLAVLGVTATGLFVACATPVDFSNPLVIGIGNLAGPRTARSFAAEGPAGVRRVVRQTALLLGGGMTAFCALMALFGSAAASWLFHGDYSAYGHTITVLAATALVTALGVAPSTGLWALERTNVNFLASVVGLGVTLVAAACLVMPLQVLGAAYGLLAGNLAGVAFKYVAFLRLSGVPAGEPMA